MFRTLIELLRLVIPAIYQRESDRRACLFVLILIHLLNIGDDLLDLGGLDEERTSIAGERRISERARERRTKNSRGQRAILHRDQIPLSILHLAHLHQPRPTASIRQQTTKSSARPLLHHYHTPPPRFGH